MGKQIVVSVAEAHHDAAEQVVARELSTHLPAADVEHAAVHRVFPAGTSGRRGRLVTIDLPALFSDERARELATALSASDAVDYAEVASPRRPAG